MPPVRVEENLAESNRCDLSSAVNSTQVAETETTSHLFREGGVTALKSEWIVAGVEEDSRGGLLDEALRFRQTRIYQQGVSEVQLPPRPEGVQIAAPVPVPLGGDRWGLVWAEARAPEGVGERWPSQLYTQLWFSERRTDGWSEPRLLLHSVAPIRWMGARSIKYVPNRGTYVVVRDFDPASGPRIMFGSVAGELQGVPLPAGLAPATAVLQADEAGTMVIVADVSRGTGRDARWELIMLRSDDEGREWSDPETIWNLESPHSVDRLQFIIDAAGGEHAFWGIGWPDGSIRHVWRSKSDGSWQFTTIPAPDGVLADWVVGVNQCRQLTMIRTVIVPPEPPYFEWATWDGTWSVFRKALQEFIGVHLFDGLSHDGRWYLVWSGWSGRTSPEVAPDRVTKLWITPY